MTSQRDNVQNGVFFRAHFLETFRFIKQKLANEGWGFFIFGEFNDRLATNLTGSERSESAIGHFKAPSLPCSKWLLSSTVHWATAQAITYFPPKLKLFHNFYDTL